MIRESLFNIPYWKIQTINFEEKKKELTNLLESYPEKRIGEQEFATNRPGNASIAVVSQRSDLVKPFLSIMNEEVEELSSELKKDIAIIDIWSVSYDKGDNQLTHNHSSMGLTGILYLDLPKDSPVTTYIQPWQDYVIDVVITNDLPIVEGDIIIVPSFVLHFSKPNKSNSKKRIISWDMKIL